MSTLKELAIEAVGNGEEYVPVDDVIKNYPEGVTVNGCHAFNFKNEVGTVFTFAEDETRCFPAKSGDLVKIYERWVDYCGGDESKVCNLLREEPVKMKILQSEEREQNVRKGKDFGK